MYIIEFIEVGTACEIQNAFILEARVFARSS